MLGLRISKSDVLRKHIAIVVGLHCANAFALWFTYGSGDFPGRDTFIDFFSLVVSEGKVPTWFSGAALLACATLLAVIATAKLRARDTDRIPWVLLSAAFFYLSFDELSRVHEDVGPVLAEGLGLTAPALHGWVVPGMICLAAFGSIYIRFLFRLPLRSRVLFIVAGSTYVLGALGMELVGNAYLATRDEDLVYGLAATLEEVLEMSGIVVFVYALLDYLEAEAPDGISIAWA